jgi:DNA (cytosine-5)-methyltransferase 1
MAAKATTIKNGTKGIKQRKHTSMLEQPTLISLFSGAGGLDLGLEQAGFSTLLANEVEPYACESLRSNRVLRSLGKEQFDIWFQDHVLSQRCYKTISENEMMRLRYRLLSALRDHETYLDQTDIIERDVRQLTAEEILTRTGKKKGEIDLVAGGPPCQPFSRAGKRELVDCDTGQLFMEFVRLVDGIRPRWFIFENVKGLVIHKADVASLQCPRCSTIVVSDFEMRDELKNISHYLSRCRKCDYVGNHLVIWEKRRSGSLDIIENEFQRLGYSCNSRVLNAADYGAPQLRERLFIIGSRDNEYVQWPAPTHSENIPSAYKKISFFEKSASLEPWQTVNSALYKTGHWRYGQLNPQQAVLWVKNVVRPHDEPVTWSLDRPAPTIGAHQSAKLAIAPLGVPEEQLLRQQWHLRGHRQGDTDPVFVEHEYLTDDELLRLQTFPISWYLHGTRMQRAFQIGNAVPPILARAVGGAIIQTMKISKEWISQETEDAKQDVICI